MPELYLGSSPHIGTPIQTRTIMAQVLIALFPATAFGVVLHGLRVLAVIAVSVGSAVAGEALFRKIIGRENRTADLSSTVTGLLLALVLPQGIPLWMAALGGLFATVVAKEFFGGLGANVFNPALTGRAFLLMSFPAAMTTWIQPKGFIPVAKGIEAVSRASTYLSLDSVSGATPLGIIKLGSKAVISGLSGKELYAATIRVLIFGNHGGSIGESSVLMILIGFLYLYFIKVIDWRSPVAMIVSVFVFSLPLGMDPVLSILTGGLFFGAVFMATDYTTAPMTAKGKLLFGAGAGLITVLIRRWGNYPEGVMFGILMMNACTPFLNRLFPRKYGFVRPPKKVKQNDIPGAAQ